MKITDVKTCDARFGYVRVYTDEGLYGTGELSHQGAGWRQIVDSMKGLLLGEDPSSQQTIGMFLILMAVIGVTLKGAIEATATDY